MASQLAGIAALPDQRSKVEQYRQALTAITASGSVAEMQAFVDHSELLLSLSCLKRLPAIQAGMQPSCSDGANMSYDLGCVVAPP